MRKAIRKIKNLMLKMIKMFIKESASRKAREVKLNSVVNYQLKLNSKEEK